MRSEAILARVGASRTRCIELAFMVGLRPNVAGGDAASDAQKSLAHALEQRFGNAGAVETLLGFLVSRDEVMLLLQGPWRAQPVAYSWRERDATSFHQDWLRRFAVHLCLAAEVGTPEALRKAMEKFDMAGHFFASEANVPARATFFPPALHDATSSHDAEVAIETYEDDDDETAEDGVEAELRDAAHSGLVDQWPGARDPLWREVPLIHIPSAGPLPYGFRAARHDLLVHQERSLAELNRWWTTASSSGVLCLPTGAGKTRTAVSFVLRHALARGSVLWLTHRVELMNQAIAAFIEASPECPRALTVGRFARGIHKVRQPVDIVVASIPTLARKSWSVHSNLRQLLAVQKHFALVVVDECHHSSAKSWRGLLEEIRKHDPAARTLGLSATPTRGTEDEKKVLWNLLGEMIHEERALDLIQQDILAKPTLHPVATHAEYTLTDKERKYFQAFEEYAPSLLHRMAEDQARNALIARTFTEAAQRWGQTLVFAATVSHGQRLTQILREQGVAARGVYATTPASERTQVVEDFRAKRIHVVINVGLFTEGTDIPGVDTLFLARPTNSRVLFQQMVGRGMRGPKVGGSPLCQIVAFHDNVVGLVHQKLSSTFTDEREAILALGCDAEEPRPSALLDEPPEAEDDQPQDDEETFTPAEVAEAEIQMLRMLLAAVTTARVAELPLRGWWLAEHGRRRAFLPVFEGEESPAAAYVDSVLGGGKASAAALAAWGEAGEVVLVSFTRVAQRLGASVRYVEITPGASPVQLRECADGILAQVHRMQHEPLPMWWETTEWPDGAADDAVCFVLEGETLVATPGTAAAVESVWERKGQRLIQWAERGELESNLLMMVNLAAKEGAERDHAQALLRAAAHERSLPARRERDAAKPDPRGVLDVLRSVPRNEWPSVTSAAAAALSHDARALPAEFLVDVLYEAMVPAS